MNPESWSPKVVSDLVAKAVDLRQGLSPDAVAALMTKGMIRRYAKGEHLLERDTGQAKFFLALSGTVRLTAFTEDGREFVSIFMEPGRMWGIHPSLDQTPETHDSKAETECEVLVVAGRDLRKLMWENREIQEAMTEILCKRLRLSLNILEQFATWNPKQRLAWRILQVGRTSTGDGATNPNPTIAISQEAIASMIALSRQRTNKLLKEFERDGLIKIEYGSIRIIDSQGLEETLESPFIW